MKKLSRIIKSPAPKLPEITSHNDNYIRKSYKITVVTPLFGGGTNAGKWMKKCLYEEPLFGGNFVSGGGPP
jgi:hypothetical protein